GVGCTTCHGPVGDMPITWRANTLYMGWCLDCHRHPGLYLRPREHVFDALYTPPPNQLELGQRLLKEYKIKPVADITSCYTCHRKCIRARAAEEEDERQQRTTVTGECFRE